MAHEKRVIFGQPVKREFEVGETGSIIDYVRMSLTSPKMSHKRQFSVDGNVN